jgi:AcrR family transcriptional regulator
VRPGPTARPGATPVPVDRRRRRWELKRARIVTEAWDLARRDGLAAISLRDVADRVDLQQPSLYAYFDSKLALYDAMFVDGYRYLLEVLASRQVAEDPRAALVEFVELLVRFSSEDPVRHQLLFQRTIPGYKPSPEAHQLALELLAVGRDRMLAIGVSDLDTADIFTGIAAGFAHQQVFNDPGGDRWLRLVPRVIEMFLAEVDRRAKNPRRSKA